MVASHWKLRSEYYCSCICHKLGSILVFKSQLPSPQHATVAPPWSVISHDSFAHTFLPFICDSSAHGDVKCEGGGGSYILIIWSSNTLCSVPCFPMKAWRMLTWAWRSGGSFWHEVVCPLIDRWHEVIAPRRPTSKIISIQLPGHGDVL